jgi:hypothetical protein
VEEMRASGGERRVVDRGELFAHAGLVSVEDGIVGAQNGQVAFEHGARLRAVRLARARRVARHQDEG